MSYKSKQCETLCKQIAMMQAGGMCIISDNRATEVHHIFFGSQRRTDPNILYNPVFYIPLTDKCHRHNPDAPHVNNDLFMELLEEKLLKAGENDKWRAIQNIVESPITTEFAKIDLNEIHTNLVKQFKQLEAANWYGDEF